jgi:hypothetical protein
MDWKSGGDTNFAPLASATGEMDCRGFWDHGKPDKGGIWTANRGLAPSAEQPDPDGQCLDRNTADIGSGGSSAQAE